MTPGRNRWFVVAAAVFGVPWLVGYGAVCVFIVTGASNLWRGLMVALLLTLLTILVDVVAAASIWAAAYALRGVEVLTVDRKEVRVARRALGMTIPFRAKRGALDQVVLLSQAVTDSKIPRPQLELRGASSRLRFGAGLSAAEVQLLERVLARFLGTTHRDDVS